METKDIEQQPEHEKLMAGPIKDIIDILDNTSEDVIDHAKKYLRTSLPL